MTKLIIFCSMFFLFYSCGLFDSDDSPSNIVNVTVNDQHFRMEANDGFYKFVEWNDSAVIMNIWRAKNELPQLWIYLPTDVVQGKVFTQNDIQSGFSVFYSSPNDEGYEVSVDLGFELKITRWEGVKGKAEGFFNGVIRKSFTTGNDTLKITDGSFKATITNHVQRP
jgi:hypothetical protein